MTKRKVFLLNKKGRRYNISICPPISLLPYTYKLSVNVITNISTNKLDAYQQAGFRKGFSSRDHMQSDRSLIRECNDFNEPLFVAFIVYNKAFDSVEYWPVLEALNNASVKSQKKVRQGDTISPKPFTATIVDESTTCVLPTT